MPVVLEAFEILHLPEFSTDDIGPLNKFVLCAHPRPLEGREGLGDKEGGAGHDLNLALALILGNVIVGLRNLLGEKGDALHVLTGLRGLSQHKVELYPVPARRKGIPGTLENDLLREPLVDHVPKPLGAGLRREGDAALFYILHLAHHIQGKGVDAQGRQGNIDALAVEGVDEEIHQPLQLGVVAGA